ncbi:unnamed protein product [Rhizophagus irregularis]|nr:unnamed protein product [Rhizophagus irregularis]CAB5374212.1 unnamed protein product [Rhizophagus irregularis]
MSQMSQKYINQYHSEEYSEKKNMGTTKVSSKRLSKIRKKISTFSLRDSGVEISDTENIIFTKNDEKITYIEETISKFVEIKLSLKRFFGIGKERRRNSEAYHQDGKTNPFE